MSERFSLNRRVFNMKEDDFTNVVNRTKELMEEKFGMKMKCEIICYAGIKATTSFMNDDQNAYLAEENAKHCLANLDSTEDILWDMSAYVECWINPVDEDAFFNCCCHVSAKGLAPKIILFGLACSNDNGKKTMDEIQKTIISESKFSVDNW